MSNIFLKTMKKRVVLYFVFQRGRRVETAMQVEMNDTLEFDNFNFKEARLSKLGGTADN